MNCPFGKLAAQIEFLALIESDLHRFEASDLDFRGGVMERARIIARGSREFPCFRRAFAQFEPFGSGVKEALVLLRILEKRHSFIHIARSFH